MDVPHACNKVIQSNCTDEIPVAHRLVEPCSSTAPHPWNFFLGRNHLHPWLPALLVWSPWHQFTNRPRRVAQTSISITLRCMLNTVLPPQGHARLLYRAMHMAVWSLLIHTDHREPCTNGSARLTFLLNARKQTSRTGGLYPRVRHE